MDEGNIPFLHAGLALLILLCLIQQNSFGLGCRAARAALDHQVRFESFMALGARFLVGEVLNQTSNGTFHLLLEPARDELEHFVGLTRCRDCFRLEPVLQHQRANGGDASTNNVLFLQLLDLVTFNLVGEHDQLAMKSSLFRKHLALAFSEGCVIDFNEGLRFYELSTISTYGLLLFSHCLHS